MTTNPTSQAGERTHTTGPWKRTVCKNENQMGYVSVISGAEDSGVAEIHNEANARLICAAPELLAQLKIAYEWLERLGWKECSTGSTTAMASAIANAEGRTR